MPFSAFGLDPKLIKAVDNLGFEQPTPIQRLAIPPLMEGRDVLAAASTGSGKTAAFLLPILNRLLDKQRGTTRVLILAPTRELAAQIAEHMGHLGRYSGLKGAAVFGGVGMAPQENAFRKGFDIIAATPGRLLDHMQHPYAKLTGLEVLVLDEADRMLDMGFMPDIKRILKQLPSRRQTLLFSATLPEPIVALAKDMLKDPVALNVERKSAPAEGISHVAYPVPHDLKSQLLLQILDGAKAESVLAFTRTKHRANRLADYLEKRGVAAVRIHGGRSQAQRTEALAGFKRGKYRVLVATDIAARGIDVEELALVVNFDVPGLPEDYIHRVGRTARAASKGDAYTLVSPGEEGDLRGIERHIGKRLPRQKVDGFNYAGKPEERFEVPIVERIAAIRARKAEDRVRAKINAERRAARDGVQAVALKTTTSSVHPRRSPGRTDSTGSKSQMHPRAFDASRSAAKHTVAVPCASQDGSSDESRSGSIRKGDGRSAPRQNPTHAPKPAKQLIEKSFTARSPKLEQQPRINPKVAGKSPWASETNRTER